MNKKIEEKIFFIIKNSSIGKYEEKIVNMKKKLKSLEKPMLNVCIS